MNEISIQVLRSLKENNENLFEVFATWANDHSNIMNWKIIIMLNEYEQIVNE